MKLRHKVSINVVDPDGNKVNVLGGGEVRLREKLLRWLFGEKKKVLVIAPGDSVYNVEIREENFQKIFDEYLDETIGGGHSESMDEKSISDTQDNHDEEVNLHEAVSDC